MEDIFTIELPATVSKTELEVLENDIRDVSGVADAGSEDSRSVDPVTLGIWIQLASGALGAISTGIPIIQKIGEMIRGKGIKGAKIKFADGTIATFDELSTKDLEKIIQAGGKLKGSQKRS